MFTLMAAMWAGLLRAGWALPKLQVTLAAGHGPLMVAGFLGTLVSLERAVAMGARWMFAAPVLSGLGGLGLIFGLPDWLGALSITVGSAVLVGIFAVIVRQQPALHAWVLTAAAVLGLIGNALWLRGNGVAVIVLWWVGYLVLTVAGERLELSRLLQLTGTVRAMFVCAAGIFAAGAATAVFSYDLGWRIAGAGLLAMAAWLLRYDIARRTVRQPGLTRFVAVSLLTGYVWLAVAGLLALAGGVQGLYRYDAVLHSIFLGFIFAMIFGHAPVIFPAVLKLPMPFRLGFYGHLALLHASLLLRVGGDLTHWVPGRQWGSMLNVFAILLFVGNTVASVLAGRKQASNARVTRHG